MTNNEKNAKRASKAQVWVRELRLYALSASVAPVLVALGLARAHHQPTPAWAVLCVLGTAVLLHLATNLINDAGDLWKGVDRPGTTGGSGVLTEGLLEPKAVFRVGVAMLVAAGAVGLPVILARGWPVIVFGLVGAAGAWAYTAGPSYKYHGLGDLGVFLLMGPILVVASFYGITGCVESSALVRVGLASLPVGFLVTAILAVNNYRDFEDDAAAGITTMAHLLGQRWAKRYTISLFALALVACGLLVLWGVVPLAAAAAVLAFVPAWGVVRDINRRSARDCGPALVVERTAKVHALYGLLCFAGLMVSSFLSRA